MKTQDLIQRILSLYSKGVESDDVRLTPRHIYNKLITVNTAIALKKLEKGEKLSDKFYTPLIINIEESPIFEDQCLVDVECKISKSECEIPEITFFKTEPLVKSVTSLDGIVKFNYITFESLKYLKGNKYTNKKQWYFLKDGYIYFVHSKKISTLRISAVFTNTEEALSYTCKGVQNNCVDMLMSEFPTDDNLIDLIITSASSELVQFFSKMNEDLTNDNKDSHLQNAK